MSKCDLIHDSSHSHDHIRDDSIYERLHRYILSRMFPEEYDESYTDSEYTEDSAQMDRCTHG